MTAKHAVTSSAGAVEGRAAIPRRRQRIGLAAVAALSIGTLAACGSDSESSEDTFCDAGDSLRSNIEGIADIDIVSGGTDAVTEQFDAIESDVEQLRDSGSDVAADEISFQSGIHYLWIQVWDDVDQLATIEIRIHVVPDEG